MKLYRFEMDCVRMGSVEATFTATPPDGFGHNPLKYLDVA